MAVATVGLGMLVGLSIGGLGGGGSVLAVPLLVYVLGQDVQTATTTSLVVVIAAALAAGARHAHHGRVCWRHAGLLVAASVPGVVAGTAAGDAIGARALLGAFAIVMVGPALLMWRRSRTAPRAEARASCPPVRLGCDLGAGLAVGFLTGMFGVGGGFLVVPALALCLAFTMRAAVGTSLAIVMSTSLIGLITHLATGRSIDGGVTILLLAGCVAGALAGARLAGRVPPRVLAGSFSGLVALVAAWLVVSTTVLGGPA